jgi:serine/threonine-protein kinase
MTEDMNGERPRVGDRYELGELLGRGGMAEVRKGTDVRLGRVVAVKRLRTDLADDPTFQARFRREAQSAASLNHPAIVAVYDTGEEPTPDGHHIQPYIVMEFVAGLTLREILREGRKILPERALEITGGVLSALDYSHRAGIIHRDIKPANVMLTPTGEVKVMDFGIARALADSTSAMTQTAAVVGTAQYLSPEQARGETVDSRSDVYSTGCLLYELLTGRPPFTGESPVSVAYQHVREVAPAPSTLVPELSPEIDAIVMKALAKRIDERYQSAAAMKADIDRHLKGLPVTAPPAPAIVETTVPEPSPDATSIFAGGLGVTDEPEEKRSRKAIIGIIAAVVVLLFGGIAFAMQIFESAPEEVSVPTVRNMTVDQATERLKEAGLNVGDTVPAASDDVPEGRVISQDPAPGDTVAPDSEVNLVVSSGPDTVEIPFLIGEPKNSAKAELEALELVVDLKKRASDEPKGTVIEMDPAPGEDVAIGSTVTVYWSAGPEEVPSVIGLTEADAIAILEEAGFVVDVRYDTTTPAEPGTVLDQTPAAFEERPQGTTVVIFVSDYEEPTPTETPTPTPTDTATALPTP